MKKTPRLTALVLGGLVTLGSMFGCGRDLENYDLKMTGKIRDRSIIGPERFRISREKLEEGYVLPQNMKFEIRDQDYDGKQELVMEYEGQKYLVKYDSTSNRINLVPYEKRIRIDILEQE